MAGFKRGSESVFGWRRGHATEPWRLGMAGFIVQRELDVDALVPILPLHAHDRGMIRLAFPDVIEKLDPHELRAALLGKLVLHVAKQLGGELLTSPGLEGHRHGVHSLAEMNRTRARGDLVSRGQEDQLTLNRRRRWAGRLRRAGSTNADGLGRGLCRRLRRRMERRLRLQWNRISGARARSIRRRGCSIRYGWCRTWRLGWKDLIAAALTGVLDGDGPVGVHVAARAGRDAARLADRGAAVLQRSGPGWRLNGP